jgi:hypothetical protein
MYLERALLRLMRRLRGDISPSESSGGITSSGYVPLHLWLRGPHRVDAILAVLLLHQNDQILLSGFDFLDSLLCSLAIALACTCSASCHTL